MMQNIPEVKLGIVAVSRDCFPIGLSIARREAIVKVCKGGLYECPVTVENELDMLKAVDDVKAAGCNALVVFLRCQGRRLQRPGRLPWQLRPRDPRDPDREEL